MLLNKDSISNQQEIEKFKKNVKPSDVATIIYTSGTTGIPKGVVLTHNNIVSNVLSASKRLPLNIGNSKALSFLPVCHILRESSFIFIILIVLKFILLNQLKRLVKI